MTRQPERALGQEQPEHPDDHAGGGADQHHPAPALDAVGRERHQPPGEEGDDRHGDEHDRLVHRKGASTNPARHQLGDVGIDGDDLDADADAGEEAPEQQAFRRGLAGHDHGCRGIAEQRIGEDRAAAKTVGEEAEEEGADEQAGKGRGDEGADAGEAEEGRCRRREQSAAAQTRRDVAGQEQIVDLETAAEREQDDEPPDIGRPRHRLEPSRDLVRSGWCSAELKACVDADNAHDVLPVARRSRAVPGGSSLWFFVSLCRTAPCWRVGAGNPEEHIDGSVRDFRTKLSTRHCERSEAIQDPSAGISGLLRCARNGSYPTSSACQCPPRTCSAISASINRRISSIA